MGNSFLHTYYKQFSHQYIDHTSHLLHYFLDNPCSFEEFNSPCSQLIINKTRICLPFKLFYVAVINTNFRGHPGEKLSIKTFNQVYYKPFNRFGFRYSFMTVLNVKLTNISLLSITLLLLSHFMQMLLISIIVSQWIQKVQSHTLQMATRTFLSLLMPSVILSLQIPLQPLHPTTQSILSSTTGLQKLNLPNTWSLIVALNILTKT